MDKTITVKEAIDLIFLIFPQKTVAELSAKYKFVGLDKTVTMTFGNDGWFTIDFLNGREFQNPISRIWNAIKNTAKGETAAEYLANIEKMMKQYNFPKEHAGYYIDPETGMVKSYQTGK